MIEVKSKDGKIVRCELNEFDYNGTFMGECFISATVKSPTPIDFTIGDYMEYRGERFVLNYTPAKQKKSSAGSCGEAFVYDNLKFNSLADELTRCRFYDYVPYDNRVHFSNLSIFSFYASSVSSLAERIQVNLDRMYSGESKWTVSVHAGCVSKDKNISVSNISCFEALSLCKKEFDVNFITRGRTISIGAPGVLVGETFGYGKGKGLYAIEQTTNEDSLIVTRLRAYGSTRNMPYMYYKDPAINNLRLPGFIDTGINTFIDSVNISKYGVREGDVYFDGSDPNTPEVYPSMEGMEADDLISAGIPVDLDSGDNGRLDELILSEQMTDNGVLPKDTGKESDKLKPNFKITLKDLGFDINKHKSIEKAAISIKSGMCIGREFEITKCVKVGNKYELTCNRFTDEDINVVFPNTDYQISGGDKFVLLNIEMPDVYIRVAEYRLLTLAKLYLSNTDESKYIYTPKIDEIYMANHPDIHNKLKEGDVFDFSDVDLDIRAKVIIQSLSIHEVKSMVPTYDVTLNNDQVLSTIEKIQNSLNGTGNTTVKIISSDIYLIKTNDLTLPTDKNVYSAARTDEEIDNILVEINDMFLRKDIPDRANKDIEFAENIIMVGGEDFSIYSNKQANSFNESGFRIWSDGDAWFGNVYAKKNLMVQGDLSSPFFVSGFPAGTGWALTWRDVVNAAGVPAKKTHLEVDDMTIRGILRVYEMVISQLLGENGTHLTADMMKIKSIDRANRIIYLDTEAGILYNPFWTDDVLMVQKFNGMPTSENDYYVTKQYEFSVEETHIGATDSDGNRLDWIKYKNFVGDEADVAIRDTLVRVDNLTNSDRKGIIKQTSVEPGSPYMDIIYAMKTNPNDAVKTRIGKLENLITPYWGRLEKYGIMCDNLYAKGRFMLHTGEDVKTKFEIVEGRLESEMSAIRQEISDKDNVLRNSSFASDTDKWEVANAVAFFSIARKFIYFNNSFYSDKRQVATVVSSEGRKVLRLKKSKIVQVNDFLRYKPDKQLVQGDGTLVWPAYYVSFQYRVKSAGDLIIGFKDQKLYHTVHMEVSPAFTSMEVSGAWDGTGDFEFSFSGDIEIYSLAMASNSLEDFKTEFLTRITQTEKEILLHAEKIERVGQRVTTAEGNISVMAGDINIWASRVTKVEGRMSTAEYSIINVLPEQISAVSSRVSVNERGIASLYQAGFLTKTTAEGALAGIFASKNSVTAASIIATVNNAGQGVVKIKADRIELDGKTIISIVEANSITTNKLTVTTGARIGGFTVNTSRLVNADNNAGLDIIYNGKKFVYINSEAGSSMISVRNDGGTGISVSAYDSGTALSLLGNTGSFCLNSIGRCYFAMRNNESFVFDLVYTAGQYGNIHFYGVKDNTFSTSKKTFSGDLCVHYIDGRALLMIQ